MGGLTGKPSMPMYLWIVSAASVWIGSLVFAAFGLFMGYLLPTENVMQFLGLGLALLSFAGGLFIPLSQFPHTLQVIAEFTPLYGLNELVHAPLLGVGVHLAWVGQRRDLAGHLRRGRRLAVPQGHRPGLTTRPGARLGPRVRDARCTAWNRPRAAAALSAPARGRAWWWGLVGPGWGGRSP